MSEAKSETKHTKGPWTESVVNRGEIVGPGAIPVAQVIQFGNKRTLSAEEANANARLIAAAPEMVEALVAAWAWFNDEAKDDRAWSMVQAALVKVTEG